MKDGAGTTRLTLDESQFIVASGGSASIESQALLSLSTGSGNNNIALTAHGTGSVLSNSPTLIEVDVPTSSSSAASVMDLLTIKREVQGGNAANGVGVGISLYLENAAGTIEKAGALDLAYSTATDSSEVSTFSFKTRLSGNEAAQVATINAAGVTTIGDFVMDAGSGAALTMGRVSSSSNTGQISGTGALTVKTSNDNGMLVIGTGGRIGITDDSTTAAGYLSSDPSALLHIKSSAASKQAQMLVEPASNQDGGISVKSGEGKKAYLFFDMGSTTDGYVEYDHCTSADGTGCAQSLSFGVGHYASSAFVAGSEQVRITTLAGTSNGRLAVNPGSSVDAALHVAEPSSSQYLTGLFEGTDAILQVQGSDAGSHAASLVLSSKPSSGNSKHWIMSARGPSETSNQGTDNGLKIGYRADSNGISSSNLDSLTTSETSMYIKTSGEVGIKVANPSVALEVGGTVKATSFSLSGGGAIGTSSDSYWNKVNGKLYYSAGLVAIGTNTPTELLHLESSSDTNVYVTTSGSSSEARLQLQATGTATSRIHFANDLTFSQGTGSISSPTAKMTLKSTGILGLSTAAPVSLFHMHTEHSSTTQEPVANLASTSALTVSGQGTVELLSRDDDSAAASTINFGLYKNSDGSILDKFSLRSVQDTGSQNSNLQNRFSLSYGTNANAASNSELVSIQRDGDVGFGTTTPKANVHVAKDLFIDSSSDDFSIEAGTGLIMRYSTYNGNNGAFIESIDSTTRRDDAVYKDMQISAAKLYLKAQVGIASAVPSSEASSTKLYCGGDAKFANDITVENDIIYKGSTLASSDERLKENIESISGALEKVSKLQAVTFNWRKDIPDQSTRSSLKQYGFIAQNVREVLPEIVQSQPDGYLTMDYIKIVPVLLAALKEQETKINNQEKRLDRLEKLLSNLGQSVNL
jgi:hypothetical protein